MTTWISSSVNTHTSCQKAVPLLQCWQGSATNDSGTATLTAQLRIGSQSSQLAAQRTESAISRGLREKPAD